MIFLSSFSNLIFWLSLPNMFENSCDFAYVVWINKKKERKTRGKYIEDTLHKSFCKLTKEVKDTLNSIHSFNNNFQVDLCMFHKFKIQLNGKNFILITTVYWLRPHGNEKCNTTEILRLLPGKKWAGNENCLGLDVLQYKCVSNHWKPSLCNI